MTILIGLLASGIQLSTPLMLGSLAEVFVERTGVMNIAIEGIFLMGAWAGFVGAYLTHNLFIGFLFAIVMGLVYGAIYGFITVKLKRHQIVTGVAMNILALGLALFLYRVLFGIPLLPLTVKPLPNLAIPLLSRIPVLGPVLFDQTLLTYVTFLLMPAGYFILFRTRLGLTLRSTGENPEAVDAAGLNVEKIRFLAVLGSSALNAVAGAFYSIAYLGLYTNGMIGGRGWIAFAICFLGNWNPLGALVGALIFGLADALSVTLLTSNFHAVPHEFIIAIPYILTILATVVRSRFNVPAVLGTPYVKERG
jgi:general nucleoside transport system permease protein